MSKSLNQRISDSFTGNEKATEARAYAADVYSSWKDISNSITRSSILILVLMAIFELLAYQHQNSSFTIGEITFTNVPPVQIVLPAVIAVILYDYIRLTGRRNDLEAAYCALVKIYSPTQRENDLDLFVKPSLPAFWAVGRATSPGITSPAEKLIANASATVAIIVGLIFPLAFESQAYYRLFQKFGYQDALLWASLVFTATFTALAFIYIIMKGGED